MVQVPVRADDAPDDAQPRADSTGFERMLDAFLLISDEKAALHVELGQLRAERANALARAERAEIELAQETARLNGAELELADVKHDLMTAEARVRELERRPWWRKLLGLN